MRYRRATDLLLSSGTMNFSAEQDASPVIVLEELLKDDRFTGIIKLSLDSLKQRAGILVRNGLCIGGFHHGSNIEIQSFDAGTVKALAQMSLLEGCTYEAFVVESSSILALSSIFRGHQDVPYSGSEFLKMWTSKMDYCKRNKSTGCVSVATPLCTALLLIYEGTRLGIYVPENQAWVTEAEIIETFMLAAAPHSTLTLSILSPEAQLTKEFGIAWG